MKDFKQYEAKKFLIDKIIVQAKKEDVSLSEAEKYMLWWTETEELFTLDENLNKKFYEETTDELFEKKIVGLFRNAFNEEGDKDPYKQAIKALKKGDHYILVMIDKALSKIANKIITIEDGDVSFFTTLSESKTTSQELQDTSSGFKWMLDKVILVIVALLSFVVIGVIMTLAEKIKGLLP